MSEMKQIDQLWILPTEAGYKIGLTAETQEDLGKITFATFPKVGQTLAKTAIQAFSSSNALGS